MNYPVTIPPVPRRSRTPKLVWVLVALGGLLFLALTLFIPVENWRGRHAWAKCKRELEAKGEILDWKAYIPPPVSDEQNIFKAPHMTEWFVGRGATNELVQRLDLGTLAVTVGQRNRSNAIAEVSLVSLKAGISPSAANLVLRYDPPVLSVSTETVSGTPAASIDAVPTIAFNEVPLRQGIDLLARQAKLNYKLSPLLNSAEQGQLDHLVTFRWTDTSAKQALFSLLNNYDLEWTEGPRDGLLQIAPGYSHKKHIYVDPAVRAALKDRITRAIITVGNSNGPGLAGPQGLEFVVRTDYHFDPAHIFLRTDNSIKLAEASEFFPTNVSTGAGRRMTLGVASTGHSFLILPTSPCSAGDYLAWSDQFRPEFTTIREALMRPYARMDGKYEDVIFGSPIPNYVAIRDTTRTLYQRSQCLLLLGQPEKALDEMTLVHELRRLSEGKPSGKPPTLVAAMINVAVASVYTSNVADGLRLHAWQEPQLRVIQKQLAEVELPGAVIAAFRAERAGFQLQFEKVLATNGFDPGVKMPQNFITRRPTLFPMEGWVYQNYVTTAELYQKMIDGFDLTNNVIRMDSIRGFSLEEKKIGSHFAPYSFFAAISIPDFTKALRSALVRQTGLDEARIACALERYRLVHGTVPESLDALVPGLIEKLPHDLMSGQPLKYRRIDDKQFLLYSVGWNQSDDGGVSAADPGQGDWVWPSSIN